MRVSLDSPVKLGMRRKPENGIKAHGFLGLRCYGQSGLTLLPASAILIAI